MKIYVVIVTAVYILEYFFLFYFFYLYFRVLTEKPVLYIRNQKQITLLYVIVFFKKSAYMNTFKKKMYGLEIYSPIKCDIFKKW